MSRRRYISRHALDRLIERVGQTIGLAGLQETLSPFIGIDNDLRYYERRKAAWAALHNRLNVGHPKGPRKPHKWTVK